MPMTLDSFIARWSKSAAAERANKDHFVLDLCEALDVPKPEPTTGDPEHDRYVFEHDAKILHDGGKITIGKIDLFKDGSLILEAKQGSTEKSKKRGTARRDTPAWYIEMRDAFGQALGYARTQHKPPPFIIVVDIGYCFDLYASFDGTTHYTSFPEPHTSRILIKDLAKHRDLLRAIFLEPHSLDPSLRAARVTREVAGHLAELAKWLEAKKHPSELVAKFLMRCLFTMFAEDVGLLPDHLFTNAIEKYWLPSPKSFVGGVQSLWKAMNDGGDFLVGKLLHFNGGLFREPVALPLGEEGLKRLLEAAKCNWADVEPAIFGTLIERALDPRERHALGAHYTPRAYVERLVRPTIEEPLRADWDVVQAEVRQLVAAGKEDAARKAVRTFQQKLCSLRVLDPACGSGNFLYVSLDLFKRLEGEVLGMLAGLGETQKLLHMETVRVTPAQFLGIEIKPWAKEIAELVLWIGYLQWHFKTYGKSLPVPEPVLQDYKNIECRDAVLVYDRVELVLDDKGKPVTRWDGQTYKKSPVTGESIPEENAQITTERYVGLRKAEWPGADFVIGNPPFLGTKRMRAALGDGYVEALRATYSNEVEDNADYVMLWWDKAAALCEAGQLRRFGLITTNSLSQTFNRRVVQKHLERGLRLLWAVPDHPWTDCETGAAVRIAMTCASMDPGESRLTLVAAEGPQSQMDGGVELQLTTQSGGVLRADLRIGADVAAAQPLRANAGISGMGVALHGAGFILEPEKARQLGYRPGCTTIRPYLGGRDLLRTRRERYLIDFSFLDEGAAAAVNPAAFQHVIDHVLPERKHNRRDSIRNLWWRFGWERPLVRRALNGLPRYIATTETAKHRVFQFVDGSILPDHMIVAIASDDLALLGILSSSIHVCWALAAGGRLGVGNDPRYNKSRCLEPFPFAVLDAEQRIKIGQLGESLDRHRKRQQVAHPDLTITGMYNVLEKLRRGEVLNTAEKVIHDHGLVSVLKKIHDDLDAAVFDAYGWPHDLTDEQILEKLVKLNTERSEEERKGLIRWLRPEFQNPSGQKAATQTEMVDSEESEEDTAATTAAKAWPKKLPEQIAAVRDLLLGQASAWTAKQVAKQFKGTKLKELELVLESLTALGLLVAFQPNGEMQWKPATAAA